jgi:ribosomal protein L23
MNPASATGSLVYFPNMAMTLVRRVSSRLPYNHFLFRVDPKHTKHEIKEYLTKVYNVDVARVTTAISLGASGAASRAPLCRPHHRVGSRSFHRRSVSSPPPPCSGIFALPLVREFSPPSPPPLQVKLVALLDVARFTLS